VQLTSEGVYLRCADLGSTPIQWQTINLWRLPKKCIKISGKNSCGEKIVVISDFLTFMTGIYK
jgi:hypothetical protein